jgi:hypothetical protein
MGAFSLGLSERIVLRFGIRAPLAIGMPLVAGISLNPVLLATMSEVQPSEAGLVSGVVNTSFMMGGALGLAVLASLADARASGLTAAGVDRLPALTSGYHAAFILGPAFAATAAALGALLLRLGGAPPTYEDPDVLSLTPRSTDGPLPRSDRHIRPQLSHQGGMWMFWRCAVDGNFLAKLPSTAHLRCNTFSKGETQ